MPGPVAAHFGQQPLRPHLRRIGRRKPLALRTSQQRVDHAHLMRTIQRTRRFHRGIDCGVRRQFQRIELCEADVQQRAQRFIAFA